MKSTPLFALSAFLYCSVALGQGSFSVRNINFSVDAPVFDAQGVPLAGSDYHAELWGGATSGSLSPVLTYYSRQRVIVPFLIGGSAGYFMDFYVGRDGTDDPTVLDLPAGGWAWLEVRAWDARLGATYEGVVALGIGGYGESALFYAKGNVPGLLLPNSPAPLIGLQSFSLRAVVPEPSTWALLALGGMAVWWKVRQQRQRRL